MKTSNRPVIGDPPALPEKSRRGRQPRQSEPVAPTDLPAEMAQGIDANLLQGHSVNALLAEDLTARQLELSTLLCRLQAFGYLNQFTGLARLKWLQEMKESKAYKGCKVLNAAGEIVELRAFEDLCECVGLSYRKVAEDLQNLAAFGEAFLEASQSLGLGYRELRRLRALPEEEREVIIDEEKLRNDPDTLLDKLA